MGFFNSSTLDVRCYDEFGLEEMFGYKARRAGALHDMLYLLMMFDRETCDKILREAILACGYGADIADPMYAGVRAFGASHFGPTSDQDWDLYVKIRALGNPYDLGELVTKPNAQ